MRLSPHPVTLRQLQYVVAVADQRNFRRAAELCGVSQPSLSAQLAQLEEALGVQLFERDRSRVLPTAAGEDLIERARRLLVDADDLVDAATRLGDPLKGTLRIGVIPTLAPYLLPEIVPALREHFPRLTLVWHEDKTATLVSRLASGELDAALVALEAELGPVESELIGKDVFVLAMPPDHPLARTSHPATAKALEGERVLHLDDGHCFREQAFAFCSRAGAEEAGFRATSLPTLAQMVAGGAGITLLPRLAVPTENRRGELKIRPFAAPCPSRTLALVWRPRSPLAAGLKQLASCIREAYVLFEARLRSSLEASPPRRSRER